MNYLGGLIKCTSCGKNYNFKNNNGQEMYICQTRKNYGKARCDSMTIKQDLVMNVIETHCNHANKNYTPTKVKLFVKEIKVYTDQVKILYKDGSVSEISDNSISF